MYQVTFEQRTKGSEAEGCTYLGKSSRQRIAGAKALKQERCGGLEKQQGVWLGQSERGEHGR